MNCTSDGTQLGRDTCDCPEHEATRPPDWRAIASDLAAALEAMRYRPEPGEPERYCDHAAAPCRRCDTAAASLSRYRSAAGGGGK